MKYSHYERLDSFFSLLEERAKEISPDYPFVEHSSEGHFDQLWAITSAYQGTNAACHDLHALIRILMTKLGMSNEDLIKLWDETHKVGLIKENLPQFKPEDVYVMTEAEARSLSDTSQPNRPKIQAKSLPTGRLNEKAVETKDYEI